jgi:hypothetical protein
MESFLVKILFVLVRRPVVGTFRETSLQTTVFRPQRYNAETPLSRFFEIIFLAGLQFDMKIALTNRA